MSVKLSKPRGTGVVHIDLTWSHAADPGSSEE